MRKPFGKSMFKLKPITSKRALQRMEQYLVNMIDLTDTLYEPTARVLGRIEAYKDTLTTLGILMEITKVEKKADRSHVKALSRNS